MLANGETKLTAQFQHAPVLGQDLAEDLAYPTAPRVFDQEGHQPIAETVPLEVAADHGREFAALVIRIADQMDDGEDLAAGAGRVERNQAYLTVVVDLGQTCRDRAGNRSHRGEEPEPDIF